MDLRYLAFCHPGNPFYDTAEGGDGGSSDFGGPATEVPVGWTSSRNAEWTHLHPVGATLPLQGWKIHVSATPENAERVLGVVRDYCVPRRIGFKYVRSPSMLVRRNSKYGDRAGSGKFVTIYPADDRQLEAVLNELGDQLEGEEGPYILSDLRWRSGPLFVRYGGFVSRLGPDPSGQLVPCIEDPEGNLVADVRGPSFRPPPWAELPHCLLEAVAARQAGTLDGFPFRVTAALHFSNGGGVYRAVDTRTGADVVLKEARPYAGLDEIGRDAVERQRTEHWALQRLAGLDVIPDLVDYRRGHEHYFLARAFVHGTPLLRAMAARNPYINRSSDRAALETYTAWALRILDRIDSGVRQMHERGVVYGDLHPGNVLVGDDDAVWFIDLETSSAVDDQVGQAIGAPGFRAPPDFRGVAVDRYAMGCLRLALFVPLTVVLAEDEGKLDELIELVTSTFPVPDDFAGAVRGDVGADEPPPARRARTAARGGRPLWPQPTVESWPELRSRMVAPMVAAAEPGRVDRLYPGDVGQFFLPAGGLSLAYGAAGVLVALADLGIEVPRDHVRWLIDATARLESPVPGLFDGLAGAAYALDRIGEPEVAHDLLATVRFSDLDHLDGSLLSGLAGVASAYAYAARRWDDRDVANACLAVVDRLLGHELETATDDRVGLLRGASGRADAYLRAHDLTGERALLEAAADALRHDLTQLGWASNRPKSSVSLDAPWRLPLIQSGSGGIALVAERLLRRFDAPDLAAAVDSVRGLCEHEYVAQAGLFQGRAGVLLTATSLGVPPDAPAVRRHLRCLGWVALPHGDDIVFLGDALLRLSCDLATGSAGVLAVVDRVLGSPDAPRPLHLFGDDLTSPPPATPR